jgi:hypothetical protein
MNDALLTLWNLTQEHPGTGSANAAAHLLLGFYNSDRFPMPLGLLHSFDSKNLAAALELIEHASRGTTELHSVLNDMTGRTDFGRRFEQLGHDYKFKGRCKKEYLTPFSPAVLVLRASGNAGRT